MPEPRQPNQLPPPFIPSWLDEYPITPVEFRIVCRVARRQEKGEGCWESYPNMAAQLGMNRDTLTAAISRLIAWGIIVREKRAGKTSVLRLAPAECWQKPGPQIPLAPKLSQLDSGRGLSGKEGVHPPGNEGCQPAENRGYEGNPSKVIPEGNPKKVAPPRETARHETMPDVGFCPLPGPDALLGKGLFLSTAKDKRKNAEEIIKKIKDDPWNWESKLKPEWAAQLDELNAKRPANFMALALKIQTEPEYSTKSLKPRAAAAIEAWRERITEIQLATNGAIA